MDSESRLIVNFFSGCGADHMGRGLAEILAWEDRELEDVHDYIQWLFPLFTRSAFNAGAPLLTESVREEFTEGANRDLLRGGLRRAFERMLRFYGMTLETSSCAKDDGAAAAEFSISRASNWSKASSNWLHPGNHNHLRITRILRSLRALGLKPLAVAFLQTLETVARENRDAITPGTLGFWREAAGVASNRQ